MLPDKAVAEFKRLYSKEIGSDLSLSDAKLEAESFLSLYAMLSGKQTLSAARKYKNENKQNKPLHQH